MVAASTFDQGLYRSPLYRREPDPVTLRCTVDLTVRIGTIRTKPGKSQASYSLDSIGRTPDHCLTILLAARAAVSSPNGYIVFHNGFHNVRHDSPDA